MLRAIKESNIKEIIDDEGGSSKSSKDEKAKRTDSRKGPSLVFIIIVKVP